MPYLHVLGGNTNTSGPQHLSSGPDLHGIRFYFIQFVYLIQIPLRLSKFGVVERIGAFHCLVQNVYCCGVYTGVVVQSSAVRGIQQQNTGECLFPTSVLEIQAGNWEDFLYSWVQKEICGTNGATASHPSLSHPRLSPIGKAGCASCIPSPQAPALTPSLLSTERWEDGVTVGIN